MPRGGGGEKKAQSVLQHPQGRIFRLWKKGGRQRKENAIGRKKKKGEREKGAFQKERKEGKVKLGGQKRPTKFFR